MHLGSRHRFGYCPWYRYACILLNGSLLVLLFSIYLLNQFLFKKTGYAFFNWYFNDLLAMPILFSYANIIISVTGRIRLLIISVRPALVLTAISAFVWEGLAPYYLVDSTYDPMDILYYFLGGFLYVMFMRKWAHIK